MLEKLTTDELIGMLGSLRGLESSLLAAMQNKGIAPPRRGLKETEAETIGKTLDQYRWNITDTAKALGIARNTLYRKIKEFGISA